MRLFSSFIWERVIFFISEFVQGGEVGCWIIENKEIHDGELRW